MARYGYGYVSEKGFLGFTRDLAEGAWKDIHIDPHDVASRRLPAAVLIELPRPTSWKLRLVWTIRGISEALGLTKTLETVDKEWDRCQLLLNFMLGAASVDRDADKAAAAERLRKALLLGNGTAQTQLGFDQEVDFGQQQLQLTSKNGPYHHDAHRAGIEPILHEIAAATEALARALGRVPGTRRTVAPSTRVREAVAACAAAFNHVHEDMVWFLDSTEPGPVRTQVEALLATLKALLERNPSGEAESEPTTPVTTPTDQ